MAIEFSKAVGLITAITSTAKRLADAREEVKINEVAIQLQGIVLDLQAEMMMIQADYQNALRSKENLENKLVEFENWEKERARYELKYVGSGNRGHVYLLKEKDALGEPQHWLCTHCYQERKKSIIQSSGMFEYYCPRCSAKFRISGSPY